MSGYGFGAQPQPTARLSASTAPQRGAAPMWNNAAPQINVYGGFPSPQQQPQQYPTAAFGRAASSSTPLPYRPAFTFGAGGVTGNGQISFQDHAQLQAQISKQLYEAAYAKAQRGEFPMGWQLENMRGQMQIDAQEAASGQSRSFFTRPEFEPQWEQYNEALINLRALGGNFDLESALPVALRGQNTGERWRGFQATPIGTSFGGGDGGGDAWGTAAPYTGPATSNFQKGSSFAGGGYNPILQSHTPGATAFSTPFNGGAPLIASNTTGGAYSGGVNDSWNQSRGIQERTYNQGGWSDFDPPMSPQRDNRVFPRGENFDGSMDQFDVFGRPITSQERAFRERVSQPMTQVDFDNQQVTGWPAGARVFPGNTLHFQFANMPDVQVMPQPRLSPNSANSIMQGQLDAYYGYAPDVQQPVRSRAYTMAQDQGRFGGYEF